MSYTALARKWRPKKFAELVGQEHVRRALVNALETGRVHHAFLFTGTRGVGKTTIARIFAKCLNCETGVTPEPCGECAACREIDSGRFVDLIEVDAASRTKVDDTRELLDNVQYSPTRGRYKVYLIDEVHMLSTHSFNALLKTLEEPPPHVKFLLATTDPQKLPVTVLSRCLQFNLKRMPVGQIADHMKLLLEKEGIPFETSGLRLVAQAADGSMRDGLSLLDQLIAFGGGKAGEEEARAMLGTISRDHVERIAELLASMNVPELVRCARSLEEFAPDYAQVLDELSGLLVRVAMKQAVSDFEGDDLYAPELLERLAKALTPEDIQLFYQTAIVGRRDLALAPDPRTGFEMTLLRMMAFRPASDAGQAQPTAPGPGRAAAARAALGGAGASARASGAQGGGSAGGADSGARGAGQGGGAAGASGAQAAPHGGAAHGDAGGGGGQHGGPAAGGHAGAPGGGLRGGATAGGHAGAPGGGQRGGASAGGRGGAPGGAQPSSSATSGGHAGAVGGGQHDGATAGGHAGATGGGQHDGTASHAGATGEGHAGDEVGGEQYGGAVPMRDAAERRGPVSAGGAPGSAADAPEGSWASILSQLDLLGAARQLASHCALVGRRGGVVRLALDPRVKFVRTPSQEDKLAQALSKYYGEAVRLEFTTATVEAETPAQAEQRASKQELESARQAFETDPGVQGLRERFGATLLPDTVRPVK
jgi:DNA polymerase-3 subunit gamma/tau